MKVSRVSDARQDDCKPASVRRRRTNNPPGAHQTPSPFPRLATPLAATSSPGSDAELAVCTCKPIPCREHNPLTLRAIRPTHRNEHQSTNQLINSHGRPRAPFNLGNSADFRFSAKWKISLSRHGPSFPAAPHTPPPIISLITERTETATPAGWGIQTSTRIIRLIWRTSQAAIIPTHMGRGGSIGSFRYPLTRRNHGMPNNPYPLPNDELEKERLNALQRCFYMFFGTNIHAPIIKKPNQLGMTSIIDDPH